MSPAVAKWARAGMSAARAPLTCWTAGSSLGVVSDSRVAGRRWGHVAGSETGELLSRGWRSWDARPGIVPSGGEGDREVLVILR